MGELFLVIAKVSAARIYIYHCKNKRVVLAHVGLPQLQLQLSGIYYHGMYASLQRVINPCAVN